MASEVSGFKLNEQAVRKLLTSEEAQGIVDSKADAVADSMNGRGHGEYIADHGTRPTRSAHAFVTTYDRHARRYVNKHPGAFAGALRGKNLRGQRRKG